MLDLNGFIAEGPGYNFFIVKNDTLYTPTAMSTLEGITRKVIIQNATKEGIKAVEANLTSFDLYTADEAFACSTSRHILPIAEVDGRKIGQGKVGPISRKLMKRLKETIKKECSLHL